MLRVQVLNRFSPLKNYRKIVMLNRQDNLHLGNLVMGNAKSIIFVGY